MIDCAVIIVAYQSAGDLPGLLASVPAAAGSMSWHAVVVDNYGLDGVDEIVGHRPDVAVIHSSGNLGYSGGLNLGLGHAPPSRFTAFLNPDLVLEPEALSNLAEVCAGDCAAAVPLVVDDAGVPSPSLRREPSLPGALGEALFGDHWAARPRWLAEMVRGTSPYQRLTTIHWATGAALLVRTDVLAEIGPWDADRFFLYSEETDYFRRIRASGREVRFTPNAVVRHRGAGSGTSIDLAVLQLVNKVRYYRKWHGRLPTAAFFAVAVLHCVLRAGRPESRAGLRALFSSRARAALPGGAG